MFVLPGLILLLRLRLNIKKLQFVIFCFASSLIINHFIVIAFAAFNIFTYPVILTVVIIENVAILYFFVSKNNQKKRIDKFEYSENLDIEKNNRINSFLIYRIFEIATWLICAVVFILFIKILLDNIGTPYELVDDRLTWYPWALKFLKNDLSGGFGYYPLLIPTNSAMVYLLTGSTSQFLTKQYMAVFSIILLLTQLDLALKNKKIGYYWVIIVTGFAILKYAKVYIASGYVDLPVAFFSFLSIYCLIAKPQNWRMILIGAFFAVGAGLTKQSGLVVIIVYPVLIYLLILRAYPKNRGKIFAASMFILLLVSPYYIYKKVRVELGMSPSYIKYLTSEIHVDKSICAECGESPCRRCTERLKQYYLNSQIKVKLGYIFDIALVGFFVTILLNVMSSSYRWILFFVTIPSILIWCLYFSYDIRNLFPSFPFIGLASGVGINIGLKYFERILKQMKPNHNT